MYDIEPLHLEIFPYFTVFVVGVILLFIISAVFIRLYPVLRKPKRKKIMNIQQLFVQKYKDNYHVDIEHKPPFCLLKTIPKKFHKLITIIFLKDYSDKKVSEKKVMKEMERTFKKF